MRGDVLQQEVAAFYEEVGGDEGVEALLLGDDGAVVAYACYSFRVGGGGAYAPDKFEFSYV